MLTTLVWLTIAVAVAGLLYAYFSTGDVFHPLVCTLPMFVFIYGYMPMSLIESGELFSYVSEDQAVFGQSLALAVLIAFSWGCLSGTHAPSAIGPRLSFPQPDAETLRRGALGMGAVGMVAWLFMVSAAGGLANAFGSGYGGLYAIELGYVRDSVYLLLAALLLLLSPSLSAPKSMLWWGAVITFATPWLIQAVLGARRGPTFVLAVGVGVSWYMARNERPRLAVAAGAGVALGLFMLFLVANRGAIYIGSNEELSTDKMADIANAAESNEYIFGTGCIITADQTGKFFWGKRVLAQIFVRPIPRAIWPTKYADTVPELEQNAGVAGEGMQAVMGWKEVPGAAAAMVADTWVEFAWGCIPFAYLCGWVYGYFWRRATVDGARWITQYVILLLLSVYLITQSLEAVLFRLIILSLPVQWIWNRSERQGVLQSLGGNLPQETVRPEGYA
ncbi:MAG: hypothetical protein NTV70_06380 [Acidobacteria bacterium]|nr:hypothetical protein [Acidobacteriota bacterium]